MDTKEGALKESGDIIHSKVRCNAIVLYIHFEAKFVFFGKSFLRYLNENRLSQPQSYLEMSR